MHVWLYCMAQFNAKYIFSFIYTIARFHKLHFVYKFLINVNTIFDERPVRVCVKRVPRIPCAIVQSSHCVMSPYMGVGRRLLHLLVSPVPSSDRQLCMWYRSKSTDLIKEGIPSKSFVTESMHGSKRTLTLFYTATGK